VREKVPDLIGAGVLVAVGAAFAFGALTGHEIFTEGGRIGPGFMPFAAGTLLVVFGVMVGVEALVRTPRGAGGREEPGGGEEGSRSAVGVIFALTLVAILLIPLLGFLVSFGLLVFALVSFVEREGLLLGAGIGVGAAVVAWLVFALFLQIPLPVGIFGAGG
jgi:putative tricarboxylic transport membrane protein